MKKYVIENSLKIIVLLMILILVGYSVISNNRSQKDYQNKITFGWPGTTFTDSDNISLGSVFIQGSLTGNDVWRMVDSAMLPDTTNNSTMIYCTQYNMKCITYTINQIGENQTSHLPIPSTFSIVSWNNYLITASDRGNNLSCTKTTVNIDRENQMVEWVQEPFNQADIHCKDSNSVTYKWIIKKPNN